LLLIKYWHLLLQDGMLHSTHMCLDKMPDQTLNTIYNTLMLHSRYDGPSLDIANNPDTCFLHYQEVLLSCDICVA
jgi:hypothetical protein